MAILGALAGLGPYLHVKTVLMSLTLLLLGCSIGGEMIGQKRRSPAC